MERDPQKIVNGRELLSLVREAFAFNYVVKAKNEKLSEQTAVIFLEDNEVRDKHAERTVGLRVSSEAASVFAVDSSIVLEFFFEKLRLTLECKVVSSASNIIVLNLPKEGTTKNFRNAQRIKLNDDSHVEALVVADDICSPALVRWCNFSKDTLGAHIITKANLDGEFKNISVKTSFATKSISISNELDVFRIEKVNSGTYNVYSVGLRARTNTNVSQTPRPTRFKTDLILNFTIQGSTSPFKVKLNELSINGFFATDCIPYCPWISVGIILKEELTGLQFSITRIVDHGFGATLVDDKIEQQLKWVNSIVPLVSEGRIVSSTADPKSLVALFLEAGGLVAKGLELKRHTLTQFESISFLSKESNSVFRWVNVAESGTILGHFSSYRIGINNWFIGDIVGGQTGANQIDRDFISKNMAMLRDMLELQGTTQFLVGSWSYGGGFWRKFRAYMQENNHILFMEPHSMIDTDSLKYSLPKSTLEEVALSEIDDTLDGLEELLEHDLKNSPMKRFLGALDITSSGMYYNALRDIYADSGLIGFKRKVFKATYKSNVFLVVLSNLPAGVSINGVFDAAFIFPLTGSGLSDKEDELNFFTAIYMHGATLGYRFAALRSFLLSDIGVKCEFVIFKSDGLEYFEK